MALCSLLKASCDRWWKGSKLRLVEITSDGTAANEDSFCNHGQATAHTHHTIQSSDVSSANSIQLSCNSRPWTACTSSFRQDSYTTCPRPSTASHAAAPAKHNMPFQECDAAEPWNVPPCTFGAVDGLLGRQPSHYAASCSQLTLSQQQLHARSQPLHGRAGSLRASLELRSGMLRSTMSDWAQHQQEQQLPDQQLHDGQRSTQQQHASQQPKLPSKQNAPAEQPGRTLAESQSLHNQQLGEQRRQLTVQRSQSSLAASTNMKARKGSSSCPYPARPPQPCFGLGALQQLSLTLGAQGLELQVLCLDDCYLGNMGLDRMAGGLARCAARRQMTRTGSSQSAAAYCAVNICHCASLYVLRGEPCNLHKCIAWLHVVCMCMFLLVCTLPFILLAGNLTLLSTMPPADAQACAV